MLVRKSGRNVGEEKEWRTLRKLTEMERWEEKRRKEAFIPNAQVTKCSRGTRKEIVNEERQVHQSNKSHPKTQSALQVSWATFLTNTQHLLFTLRELEKLRKNWTLFKTFTMTHSAIAVSYLQMTDICLCRCPCILCSSLSMLNPENQLIKQIN